MSIISAGNTTTTAFKVTADTTGNLAFQTQGGANTITVPNATGTILTTGAPQSGGVIQVVNATTTSGASTTSTSFVTTGFSVSITPKFSTSKILLMLSGGNFDTISTSNQGIYATFYRNSTNIGSTNGLYLLKSVTARLLISGNLLAYDSPATTSSTTYTLYIASEGGQNVSFNNAGGLLMTLIAMEVAA